MFGLFVVCYLCVRVLACVDVCCEFGLLLLLFLLIQCCVVLCLSLRLPFVCVLFCLGGMFVLCWVLSRVCEIFVSLMVFAFV